MKRVIWGIVLLPSLLSANYVAPNQDYSKWANQALTEVWSGLDSCGVTRTIANHPSLPPPQIPATEAVLSRSGRLLAYTLDTTGYLFPPAYAFKNPNGGYVHSVTYSAYGLSFNTPYGGTVAMSNVVNSGNGPYYQFFCHGQLIPAQNFYACVKANWINAITTQLCRSAR